MNKKSGWRWIALMAYLTVTAVSQFLWLNFAPLMTFVEKKYAVTESTASLLILVFPLIYVGLSIPAGRLTDSRGYKWTVALGSWIMALFACLRIFEDSFWVLLVGQVGIAVAQPFIVNGITKLVLDWFDKDEAMLATGLGTVGMFLGMIAGLVATPWAVEAIGFRATMGVFALVTTAAALFFQVAVRTNSRDLGAEAPFFSSLKILLGNKNLVVLFVLSFLGLGFFNGFTTWLEPILAPNGIDAVKAGMVGGVLIFGGIVGAAILPAVAQKLKKKKLFLVLSIMLALAFLYPLCAVKDYLRALMLSGTLGFFFLPAFALLLEIASELAGESLAGSATGILMLTGNAGGVVVIVAMDAIRGGRPSFQPAVYLMLAILALALFLSLFLDLRRTS